MANPEATKRLYPASTFLFFILVLIYIISGIICPYSNDIKAQNKENENVGSTKDSDSLFVKEFLLANDVVERQPIDVVQTFDMDDDTGWCYAKIYNGGTMRNVNFKWYHEGELYYNFEAKVGSSANWRTYSSVTLREGSWRVELTGPHDSVMKEIRFHVSD